jgi:hypothetical protein
MSCDRTTMADLARLMADSTAPIYVLDEDRRIVFCNAAFKLSWHMAVSCTKLSSLR